jgi:hypothetical protein
MKQIGGDQREMGLLMPFEVLDFPFMLLPRRPRLEGSEVPAFPRFGILLARIEPIPAR